MVDITPGVAFLAALQNQFNAARQGQGRGTNSLIPGLPGGGEGDSGSVIGSLGSGGISAGGVPGTATTGSSIANSLIGGGASAGDPLAQQVSLASGFGSPGEPGERGDLGAGVTGGDAELLLSILSGNPLLMAASVAQAVNNQNFTFGNDVQPFTRTQNESFQDNRDVQPGGFGSSRTSTPLGAAEAEALFRSTGRPTIQQQIRERDDDRRSRSASTRSETTSRPGGIGGV